MVRWGIECGSIDLRLVTGEENCADIFTKALVGETSVRHRRTVLSLLQSERQEEWVSSGTSNKEEG